MITEPTPATAPNAKPRRLRLQFSLRTLLVLMLLAACFFTWLGYEYRRGQRQHEAIAQLEAMEAQLTFDDEATQANWRRRVFGNWYPEIVTGVSFRWGCEVDDVSPLAALPALQDIELHRTRVADLEPLRNLEQLRVLMTSQFIRDISPLAHKPNLLHLNIAGPQVSDISPLADAHGLRSLLITNALVTDLTPLARLEQLEYLCIGNLPVGDLTPLSELRNLDKLIIAQTQVSDLTPLAGLYQLESLVIHGNPIHDLTPLYGLKNLKTLYVYETQVTPEQIAELRAALPQCDVVMSPPIYIY